MNESNNVRRSGRQRTPSTRFKDMELTLKSPEPPVSGPSANKESSPQKHPINEQKQNTKTSISSRESQNKTTKYSKTSQKSIAKSSDATNKNEVKVTQYIAQAKRKAKLIERLTFPDYEEDKQTKLGRKKRSAEKELLTKLADEQENDAEQKGCDRNSTTGELANSFQDLPILQKDISDTRTAKDVDSDKQTDEEVVSAQVLSNEVEDIVKTTSTTSNTQETSEKTEVLNIVHKVISEKTHSTAIESDVKSAETPGMGDIKVVENNLTKTDNTLDVTPNPEDIPVANNHTVETEVMETDTQGSDTADKIPVSEDQLSDCNDNNISDNDKKSDPDKSNTEFSKDENSLDAAGMIISIPSEAGAGGDGSVAVKLINAPFQIKYAKVTRTQDGELMMEFDDSAESSNDGKSPDVANDGNMECNFKGCNYSTKKRVNWYKHRQQHDGRKHECSMCPYTAKTTSNLKRHMLIHTDIKNYVCHVCKDTFRQKIHLIRHIRYKHEVKKVQCAYCDYRCANLNPDLRIHMRRRHLIHISEDEARILCSCKECGFVAASKRDLAQHMKFHRSGPELKLFCEQCSFVTDCASRLERHERVHSKEKPYQCGLCEYRASQKEHVIRHMKSKHHVEAERTSSRQLHITAEADTKLPADLILECTDADIADEYLHFTVADTAQMQAFAQNLSVAIQHEVNAEIQSEEPVIISENDDQSRVHSIQQETDVIEQSDTITTPNQENTSDIDKQCNTNEVTDISDNSKETTTILSPQTNVTDSEASASQSPTKSDVSQILPEYLNKDKMFSCPHCLMKFSKLLNLHKHLAMQHKVPKALHSLSCCVCDYQTDKKSNLLIHMRKHNLPRKQSIIDPKNIDSLLDSPTEELDALETDDRSVEVVTDERGPGVRVYNCVQCKFSTTKLDVLYNHVNRRHGVPSEKKTEGMAVCVVENQQVRDLDDNLQTVMLEMWPGSPATPVYIENPPKRHTADVDVNAAYALQNKQTLAGDNDNILSDSDIENVVIKDAASNIQVPAEQLMQLSSGDFIEIDGEMYKVEFTEESA